MEPDTPQSQDSQSTTQEPDAKQEQSELSGVEAASEPAQAEEAERVESSAAPMAPVSWQASEFVQHDKPTWWYPALIGAAAVLSGIFYLLHQPFTIVLVVVMAAAVWVYSRKEPRTLRYTLDEKGITIESKLIPYDHFRSFSRHQEVGWQEFELEPAKRFAPRLTLIAEKDNFEAIEQLLTHYLPRVERSHDPIERAARYIKF